jgi:DNA-binding MarR family transcriptional regulator
MSQRTVGTSPIPVIKQPIKLSPEAGTVLRQFRVVFNAIKTHFQQIEKQAGIGGAQLWALSLVAQQQGMGVGELAQAMDVHQSTASNLVRSLVAKNLMVSNRANEDRRTVSLELTQDALTLLARAPGPLAGVLPDALGQLDSETLARLHGDLGALIQILGAEDNGKAAHTPLANL